MSSDEMANHARPRRRATKWLGGAVVVVTMVSAGGVAGATWGSFFGGRHRGDAAMSCPGGMSRLSHVFDADASVFPGDPPPVIDIVFNIDDDGFLVEEVTTGTHTGTHLDAPGHFIGGGTTVDDLRADQLVWTSYVIDVRNRTAADPNFQVGWNEIRRYEQRNGRIPAGAMVILRTGFEEYFGTDAYLGDAPGFSGDAVQLLFDRRHIGGIGSDTFGPDATSDEDFLATYTALLNEGVVLTNLNNLGTLDVSGDLVIASAVRLRDGSGYQVDPLGCLGR